MKRRQVIKNISLGTAALTLVVMHVSCESSQKKDESATISACEDTQELNYAPIMKAITKTGFKGYVAQEFIPTYANKLEVLKEAISICDIKIGYNNYNELAIN